MKRLKRNEDLKIGRREFINLMGISTTNAMIFNRLNIKEENAHSGIYNYDLMKEVMRYRKIDAHCHVSFKEDLSVKIDLADRLGIEKLVISRPISRGKEGPKEVREANDLVFESMKQFPDRFIGQCFINPLYRKESLEEIDRCVDAGMAALKVYHQVKINDPLFYPIIEKCIELKIIILMHAECELGVGGYRMKYDIGVESNKSIPEDFVEAAQRYPEAMLQYAHITSFDWEYAFKALRDSPNVYVDVSGSNNDEGVIDFALKTLGEDRLFFGTDNSFPQSVGRILSSNLNERQRKKIFFENYNNILRKAGNNVA